MFRPPVALAAVAFTLLATSCNAVGNYSLAWTFDAMTATPSAWDCSSRGVGTILLSVEQGGAQVATDLFPCDTQPGNGVLAAGTYDFVVTGGDFQGKPLLAPVTVKNVDVADGGTAQVKAALQRNSQCSDGIDNDFDGLVDLADPGCGGNRKGDDEAAK